MRGLYLAAVLVGIAAFVAIPGCLNPRPEELPSSQNTSVGDPSGTGPVRETCSDNPYLASCAPDLNVSAPAANAPADAPPVPAAPGFADVGDGGNGTQADAGVVADPETDSISDAGP